MSLRAPLAIVAMLGVACRYPSPLLGLTRGETSRFECRRLSQAEAHVKYPDQVPPEAAKTLAAEQIDALICEPRFLPIEDREPRDEAILSTLRSRVGELTLLATSTEPGPLTWHVDAFYPNAEVAQKISSAAKTELFERGRHVSDRVPVLAAGDIAVLSRMTPAQSYPVACKRSFAESLLGANDVFMGLMIIDPRETELHAGLCIGGQWRWLQ